MGNIEIKNKPHYCKAWVSKVSGDIMCNTIPCCGFFVKGVVKFVVDATCTGDAVSD